MKINFNFEEKNVKLGLENQFTIQEFLEVTPVKILMLKGEKGDTVSAEWGTITGDIADQTDLATELDTKADKSTTYTKTEVDTALETKADKSTTYTKTEVDTALETKADTTDIPDVSDFITKDVDNLTNYTKTSNLSTVATSGSYNDLSNKPTIPSKTSDLTNDSNFAVTNADNKFSVGQTIAGETVVGSIRSKNMFDPNNLRTGYYKVADGTYDNSISYKCTSYKIEVDNTKEYVLTTGSTQSATMYVMYYDANGTYLGYGSTPITQQYLLHTSQYWGNTKYVNFRFDVNNVENIQLETGNTATPFLPYQSIDNGVFFKSMNFNQNVSAGQVIFTLNNLELDTLISFSYHSTKNNFGGYLLLLLGYDAILLGSRNHNASGYNLNISGNKNTGIVLTITENNIPADDIFEVKAFRTTNYKGN